MRYLTATFLILVIATSSMADSKTVYPEMMFILDASGSMWGKAGAETKIEAARRVMKTAVPNLPVEVKIGLTAYGHNRKGDCSDIEILIPIGTSDRNSMIDKVENLSPKGKTPITGSLQMVTDLLKQKEEETTIVLISDGEETCDTDPCGAVKQLKAAGIKFILHVVGFNVTTVQKEQLSCIAGAGGGNYFEASDGDALLTALTTVGKEIEEKVEKAKVTVKKAATKLGKLHLTIPQPGLESLNTIKIIRKKDGKILQTVKNPGADATYPLLSGEYELWGGFANTNYKPDSDVAFGDLEIKGGETTEVSLGLMSINIADSLKKMPAGAVVIARKADDFKLVIAQNDNPYYLYKSKPLLPGEYTFNVHYRLNYLYEHTPDTPVQLSMPVSIKSGETSTVTIDSGIQLKKAQDPSVTGWELINSSGQVSIKIGRAFNGDYPLWQVYGILPGTYQLNVLLDGMEEPLPVADGLEIKQGELLLFDAGL